MTESDARESLPALLVRLRDEAGLTQDEAVARMQGISRTYLSRLENGHQGLGKKNARRIALAYDVPAEQLLAYVDQGKGLAPADREQLATAVQSLAEVAPRLAAVADRLEALLGEQQATQAARKRRRGS